MKKEEQIRMLLHPEKYTDEQLDQMLDETNIPVPDANEAWKSFKKNQNNELDELHEFVDSEKDDGELIAAINR